MSKLLVLAGIRGAGKSYLADRMLREYNRELELVETFATRAPRFEGERGHRFYDKRIFSSMYEEGLINVRGNVPGEDEQIGVDYKTLKEIIDRSYVPFVVTGVPDIIRELRVKSDQIDEKLAQFSVFYDVNIYVATDRRTSRDGDQGVLRSRALARMHRQQLRVVRFDFVYPVEQFESDKPIRKIFEEMNPIIREFMERKQ
jgi:hypothetical protein